MLSPRLARPIGSRERIFSFRAVMTCHEALFSGWDVLFNAHLGISKPDDPLLASLAGLDHKLLRAIGSPLRTVS